MRIRLEAQSLIEPMGLFGRGQVLAAHGLAVQRVERPALLFWQVSLPQPVRTDQVAMRARLTFCAKGDPVP